MDKFMVPRDPHPGEPDELTPDTAPMDWIERPHDESPDEEASKFVGGEEPEESPEKDLDEPGPADRTPRP